MGHDGRGHAESSEGERWEGEKRMRESAMVLPGDIVEKT